MGLLELDISQVLYPVSRLLPLKAHQLAVPATGPTWYFPWLWAGLTSWAVTGCCRHTCACEVLGSPVSWPETISHGPHWPQPHSCHPDVHFWKISSSRTTTEQPCSRGLLVPSASRTPEMQREELVTRSQGWERGGLGPRRQGGGLTIWSFMQVVPTASLSQQLPSTALHHPGDLKPVTIS